MVSVSEEKDGNLSAGGSLSKRPFCKRRSKRGSSLVEDMVKGLCCVDDDGKMGEDGRERERGREEGISGSLNCAQAALSRLTR
jgi:hypothetical protein